MTLTCRAVDSERVNCPNCYKSLTIRVLAYKHAKYCRAFQDRVVGRTENAQASYRRMLRAANGATSESSEDSPTEKKTINTDSTHANVETPMETDDESTSESAPSLQKAEKGNENTRQASQVQPLYQVPIQMPVVTQCRENTSWVTPQLKNTPQPTRLAPAGIQSIENRISQMFHRPSMI